MFSRISDDALMDAPGHGCLFYLFMRNENNLLYTFKKSISLVVKAFVNSWS